MWKISCLHTLLLPAGLLPSLPVKLLGGDCSRQGRGGCTGVHRISVLPCPNQVPNELRVSFSSLEPCMGLEDVPPPPQEMSVHDGPETLGLAYARVS